MQLTQLAAFREVMTAGSLSQAARNLNRTQPAVSLAIKSLEENLGMPLFSRVGRQLIPVPEAHYLLAESDALLSRLESLDSTMKSLASATSGRLRVAAMPGPSTHLIPAFLSREIGNNASIRLSLSSRNTMQIRKLTSAQSIDFGFGDGGPDDESGTALYQAERIQARCFCAMPQTHPLAQKERIDIGDLADAPLGLLPDGHFLNRNIADAFAKTGASLNMTVECQFFLPLMHFIAAGQCLSIVDPLAMATEQRLRTTQDNVTFRPLSTDVFYEYAIYTPRYRPMSKLAEKIRNGLRSEIIGLLTMLDANPHMIDQKPVKSA
ncbi:LysR family transcriptional regulator [Thalassospira sp. MA62]|nr:LysR family transcriptional regulator [Thalassospira sp. MA62]